MDKTPPQIKRCPAPRAAPTLRPRAARAISRRVVGAGMAIAMVSTVTGCGMFAPPPPPPPKPPPPPPKLAITVVAAARLNPDSTGRPSPVTVRIYELKSPAQFGNADFMMLFDQDKSVLAGDIVAREEFVLRPGESKGFNKLLAPETQAIGVMAAFRDLERAKWRGVAMLAAGKDNTVAISLDDVYVKVAHSAKDVVAPK